ncbi:MAG: hypothetical protein AAGE80_05430 [Pseudomonadota bacterium]
MTSLKRRIRGLAFRLGQRLGRLFIRFARNPSQMSEPTDGWLTAVQSGVGYSIMLWARDINPNLLQHRNNPDRRRPDRIWAWPYNADWSGGYYRQDTRRPLDAHEKAHGAEYIRCDLVEEPRKFIKWTDEGIGGEGEVA